MARRWWVVGALIVVLVGVAWFVARGDGGDGVRPVTQRVGFQEPLAQRVRRPVVIDEVRVPGLRATFRLGRPTRELYDPAVRASSDPLPDDRSYLPIGWEAESTDLPLIASVLWGRSGPDPRVTLVVKGRRIPVHEINLTGYSPQQTAYVVVPGSPDSIDQADWHVEVSLDGASRVLGRPADARWRGLERVVGRDLPCGFERPTSGGSIPEYFRDCEAAFIRTRLLPGLGLARPGREYVVIAAGPTSSIDVELEMGPPHAGVPTSVAMVMDAELSLETDATVVRRLPDDWSVQNWSGSSGAWVLDVPAGQPVTAALRYEADAAWSEGVGPWHRHVVMEAPLHVPRPK